MIDTGTLGLALSITALLGGLALAAIVAVTKRGVRETEPYLCGESEKDFADSVSPPATEAQWGLEKTLNSWIEFVRRKIHTGVLDDWWSLMITWAAILLAVSVLRGWIRP